MVGNRLKEERERLGLTQPEFAELAGAKKRTVIDWQNGASSPTAVQLAALAAAGVDVLYVVTGLRAQVHQRLASISQASNLLQNAGASKEVGQALLPALVELLSGKTLDADESKLVENYRRCSQADQAVLLQMAARFAGEGGERPKAPKPVKKPTKEKAR